MKKKKHAGGRPRELGASIAVNLRLPAHAWAELKAKAEYGDVSMSQLARDAICEWLLACTQGQRPITGRVTKPTREEGST